MPAMMMVLALFTATAKYGFGPFSPATVNDRENCESSWWVNMLLLHNIVETDKQVSLLFKHDHPLSTIKQKHKHSHVQIHTE